MLEDSMDKKSTRPPTLQGPAKGNATDSKKVQDAQPNIKQIPKGSRQRELPGNNGYKNDQNRRPTPQKSKAMDKRPRPRGGNNSGGKENTQISDEQLEAEFGSLFHGGSKKQNLNHLLNFHYEPRGDSSTASRSYTYNTKQYGYSTKALMATQTHKYNKEQFLQANCQFVVRSGIDYSPYMVDPDLLVNWDYVELIRVWSNDLVTCPICLYPPVAGKITRCGHIFCWSCILHYLALSDKSWRKCPICYESVHKKDLKSVESISCLTYSVGQEITLQLMKREKGSLIATPVGQSENRFKKPLLYISEQLLDTVYSKLLLADYEDVISVLRKEELELEDQLTENAGCPELCFVEEAVDLLIQRRTQLEQQKESYSHTSGLGMPVQIPETNLAPIPSPAETQDIPEIKPVRLRNDSLSTELEVQNIRAEDLYIDSNQTHVNSQPTKYFYFYQAMDGQQIYLHAVNVRMLEMSYTSLEHAPHTIKGAVLEKESGSMTSELRRRLRYLQHIPITCQFEVVEITMKHPVISEKTVEAFEEQLDQRKRRRARQAREERRRERKIQESERRLFGGGPTPNLKIESLQHFPQCGTVEFPPPSSLTAGDESSEAGSPFPSGRPSISSSVAALVLDEDISDEAGPSFAQMLREGKSFVSSGGCGAWPTIGTGGNGSSTKFSTPWAKKTSQDESRGESDTENYIASPSASFNIAEALEKATAASVGKKKKKGKKILFST